MATEVKSGDLKKQEESIHSFKIVTTFSVRSMLMEALDMDSNGHDLGPLESGFTKPALGWARVRHK